MTIYVKSKSEDKKRTIRLWVPLWLLKQKWLLNIFYKEAKKKNNGGKETEQEEIEKINALTKQTYKDLKKFIKTNGHFNLVEVDAKDGTRVKIRV